MCFKIEARYRNIETRPVKNLNSGEKKKKKKARNICAIVLVAHIMFSPEICQVCCHLINPGSGLKAPKRPTSSLVLHAAPEDQRLQGTKCCRPFYPPKGNLLQIHFCKGTASCFRGDTSCYIGYKQRGGGSGSLHVSLCEEKLGLPHVGHSQCQTIPANANRTQLNHSA